jgi:transposase
MPKNETCFVDPAARIIKLLGGIDAVAEICQVSYTSPYRWQRSREQDGTDGFIPRKYHARLIKHAKSKNIRLRPVDFIE